MRGMKEVCIVSLARTPMGAFGGSYKALSAVDLGVSSTKEALRRSKILPEQVDDVYFGNVISANLGQAPAKQVALKSGIPSSVPCTTVNKVCASGMKAIEVGIMNIALGISNVVVSGGMESMSNVPRYLNGSRFRPKPHGVKFGNIKPSTENNSIDKLTDGPLVDGLSFDGLSDPFEFDAMGTFGVLACVQNNIPRKEIDEYTLRSYKLAMKSSKEEKLSNEIVPVPGTELELDEEVKLRGEKMTAETLSNLKPAFSLPKKYKDWTSSDFTKQTGVKYESEEQFEGLKQSITAASSSTMSDGAATLVLASKEFCEEHGIEYLCTIKGWGQASQIPENFTSTPGFAVDNALRMANLSPKDIDFFEVNEAFAVVPLLLAKHFNMSDWEEKLNVYGGACSMGHPIGCSGARIVCTLLSVLMNENGRYGCASICNGGGGASALIIERPVGKSKL